MWLHKQHGDFFLVKYLIKAVTESKSTNKVCASHIFITIIKFYNKDTALDHVM